MFITVFTFSHLKWKCIIIIIIILLFWEAFMNVLLRGGEEFFELRIRWPFLQRWWNAAARFGYRCLLLRWIHFLRIRNSKLARETRLSPARTQCWVFQLTFRMYIYIYYAHYWFMHVRVKELDFWTEEIIMMTCTYDTIHTHPFNYLNSNWRNH